MSFAIAKASPVYPGSKRESSADLEKRKLWAPVYRLLSGTHSLALVDQAVVSGVSFLTTILVGRYTDSSQLGSYAIAVSLVASSLAIQGSLITVPYSIQRHRPLGTPAECAGGLLAQTNLFSALIVTLFTTVAFGLILANAQHDLIVMAWALAGVMPFALLREFFRRLAFAHLEIAHALLLDIVVATLQLAALLWLGWMERMSAVTACGAIGLASGLPAIGWLYFSRASFVIRTDQLKATMKQSWRLGKWLAAGQITVQIQLYVIYWLSVLIAGAAVTGVYAACMSIVSFANPLIFGIGNILSARSALSWKNGGGTGLRRQAMQDAVLIGVLMTLFCVLAFFVGEDAMRVLYHGKEYEGQGEIIVVLALATLAASLSMPASIALATIERPVAVVIAGAIGAALTVVLVWYLMVHWGLPGAAFGLLVGSVIGTSGRWIAFLKLVPRRCNSVEVTRVFEQLAPRSDANDLIISHLGEGDHANVYEIHSKSGQTVWQKHRSLIVKLYKSEAALTFDMVSKQIDALNHLRLASSGHVINGWEISAPEPLYDCKSPLALVMTRASGQDLLSATAARDGLASDVLHSVAGVLAAVLQKNYLRETFHGDLGLQNIFLDVETKKLSFIDPGTLESCRVCNAKTKRWDAAILDLGHMLCDAGTDVKTMIRSPAVYSRRQILTEMTLRSFIEAIEPFKEKQRVLGSIADCAKTHLAETIPLSWSPRGLWRWFVKKIAVHRIDSMAERLSADQKSSSNRGVGRNVERAVHLRR